MSRRRTSLYLPPRNIVGSLIPIAIVTWYFVDKIGTPSLLPKIGIVAAAAISMGLVASVSSRTRRTRRPMWWRIYDSLTGEGRLPLRLFSSAVATVVGLGIAFECAGLNSSAHTPTHFIARFVEVDLYWTIAVFLGLGVDTIEPVGFSHFLTIITTICGLLFWGMYISVLVNKHLRLTQLPASAPKRRLDEEHFNE